MIASAEPRLECASELSTVGIPLAHAPAPGSASLLGAAAASSGCTLAVWTSEAIHISWDGGQTFAQTEMSEPIKAVVASVDRVVVLSADHTLGVVARGKKLVWRQLAVKPREVQQIGLFAAGKWTVVALNDAHTSVLAVSDDDAATWRYLSPPKDATVTHLDATGVLTARAPKSTTEPDGMHIVEFVSHYYQAKVTDGIWRETRQAGGLPLLEVGPWVYTTETDAFWGCGGSSRLVASYGNYRVTLVDGMRTEVFPLHIATNGSLTFALRAQRLYRIAGGTMQDLGEVPPEAGELVGIDGQGTMITRNDQHLLRWTARDGWRVLL